MMTDLQQADAVRLLSAGKVNDSRHFPECMICGKEVERNTGRVWRDPRGQHSGCNGAHILCLKIAAGYVDAPAETVEVEPGDTSALEAAKALPKLVGTGTTGDFVLQHQETADADGFSHVSKIWRDQCLSFDEARDKLTLDNDRMIDVRAPMSDWRAVVADNGRFAFQFCPQSQQGKRHARYDGGAFEPTEFALRRMMSDFKLPQGWVEMIHPKARDEKRTGEYAPLYEVNQGDHQRFADLMQATIFDRKRFNAKHRKDRLWRGRDDGTLRACLSDRYTIINNNWYLAFIESLIGKDALVSHWRGDGDSMRFNVLVPDSVRDTDDGEYGGMISCGNSEIGSGSLYALPSLFRAICMNGCIWDQTKGVKHKFRHVGDERTRRAEVVEILTASINAQLGTDGEAGAWDETIQRFLRLEDRSMGDVPVANVIAQVQADHGNVVRRKDLTVLAQAFRTERQATAKGLVNALTRAGQKLPNARWFEYDSLGGHFLTQSQEDWGKLLDNARKFDEAKLEKLAIAV